MDTHSDWYGFSVACNIGNEDLSPCSLGRGHGEIVYWHKHTTHTHTFALYGGHINEQKGSNEKFVIPILQLDSPQHVLSTNEGEIESENTKIETRLTELMDLLYRSLRGMDIRGISKVKVGGCLLAYQSPSTWSYVVGISSVCLTGWPD